VKNVVEQETLVKVEGGLKEIEEKENKSNRRSEKEVVNSRILGDWLGEM
jgi:hypothetical protein